MRIGMGLPAAIPGVAAPAVGDWAAAAEHHGFRSVSVIDRLVYDNLNPLVALLFGGLAPAAFTRAARFGEGWVAPSFGFEPPTEGIASVAVAWRAAGRRDQPRVVVERYFCLGPGAATTAEHYLAHYYGRTYLDAVLADTLTSVDRLDSGRGRLRDAGCVDVVLLPCDADLHQVDLLADALTAVGAADERDWVTA